MNGRPPLEPRIKALEEQVADLQKRLSEMYEYFNQGKLPAPQYQPQFRVFPGANPASNGST